MGWLESQWAAILIPSLVRLTQQVVDTLAAEEVKDYGRVMEVILQMLNLNPEDYPRQLREVAFGPDYHPLLTTQKIQVASLQWLQLVVETSV